jgi:hypothetical protein
MMVNIPPTANAGNDQTIGYGASTQLNGSATGGSGNYTYHWEPTSMLINPNIQNPTTINLTSSIPFILSVTDVSSGCVENDQILVTVTGGFLSVDVVATPNPSCAGDLVQLMSIPSGGTGNYTYMWSSNPPGFTSTLPNPAVYPNISTTYTLVVDDGFTTTSDSILVVVNPLVGTPNMPIGPDTVDLYTVIFTEYTTTATIAASSYIWEITPASAGTISGTDTIGTVTWNPTYLGTVTIKVKAVNGCGESSWSADKHTFVNNTTGIPSHESLQIDIYPNPSNGIFSIRSSEDILWFRIFQQLGKPIDEIERPDMLSVYDYSSLPVGVYIVHIVSSTKTIVKKIIITK